MHTRYLACAAPLHPPLLCREGAAGWGGMVAGEQRSFDASDDRKYHHDGVQDNILSHFDKVLHAEFQMLSRQVSLFFLLGDKNWDARMASY